MIQAYPTKNGTGIIIYGDYGDLRSLYQTIHSIAEHGDEYEPKKKGINNLLMNFAYEIRKAYSGHRIIDELEYPGSDMKFKYFGFKVVWTDMLIYISAIRHKAGFRVTTKLDQANLYILEYIIEKTLFDYDAQGANEIKEMIGQRITVSKKHVFQIYQKIHIEFLLSTKGKRRFRNIPNLIGSYFSSWRDEYKILFSELEATAQKQKCDITELEFENFPEIVW